MALGAIGPQTSGDVAGSGLAALAEDEERLLSIEDGHLDEAHQLLDGLTQRPRLHIQEAFSLYGALAMLNRARGQHETADALIANLEEFVEDEGDARRLAQAKRRVEHVTAGGRVKSVLRTLLRRSPRP